MYAIINENKTLSNPSNWKIDDNYQFIDFNFEDFKKKPIGFYKLDSENNIIENPDFEREELDNAKANKYKEACLKAKSFLEEGKALFPFENYHIEATDGNIAKMTAYALSYATGQLNPEETVVWNTKEDKTVELNKTQISEILSGLGRVQTNVWNIQYPKFLQKIEDAQTIDEINEIEIEYKEV